MPLISLAAHTWPWRAYARTRVRVCTCRAFVHARAQAAAVIRGCLGIPGTSAQGPHPQAQGFRELLNQEPQLVVNSVE